MKKQYIIVEHWYDNNAALWYENPYSKEDGIVYEIAYFDNPSQAIREMEGDYFKSSHFQYLTIEEVYIKNGL